MSRLTYYVLSGLPNELGIICQYMCIWPSVFVMLYMYLSLLARRIQLCLTELFYYLFIHLCNNMELLKQAARNQRQLEALSLFSNIVGFVVLKVTTLIMNAHTLSLSHRVQNLAPNIR